jgi:peptidoglycan/LPS O-acetylase OafA/YrhL
MNYIKEVDGLRAIAVVLVVLFHLNLPFSQGGFIGVDIFFVISGFLISSIILHDLQNNKFSFQNFYFRRIRRIFPVLFLVLIVTLIFSFIFLHPSSFHLFIFSVISSTLFFSNFFFWTKTGYFNELSLENPVLHTWSLSVEEQFYIFFPIFIFFVFKYFKKYIFHFILIFSIGSFIFSLFLNKIDISANFYFTPSRIWELLIGSIISIIYSKYQVKSKTLLNILSLFAIFLLFLSLYYFSKNTIHPGPLTLFPVVSTSLLLLYANNYTIVGKILSNNVFTFIGKLSYSIYLWHIPLYVFLKIFTSNLLYPSFVFFYILILLLLSYFSYRFVEIPLKNISRFKTKTVNIFFVFYIPFFIFLCFISLKFYDHKYGLHEEYFVAKNDWFYPGDLKKGDLNGLWYVKKNMKIDILFFGDSHIEQYAPLASSFSKKYNKNIAFYTKGGCPPLPNIYEKQHPDCSFFFDQFLSILENNKGIDKVVLSGYFNSYFSKLIDLSDENYDDLNYKYFFQLNNSKIPLNDSIGIYKSIEHLMKFINDNKHIKFYFLLDNPRSFNFDPEVHLKYMFFKDSPEFKKKFPYFEKTNFKFSQNQKNLEKYIIDQLSKCPNLKTLKISDFICSNENCAVFINNKFIYKDNNHLRPFFVIKYLQQPLENFIFH